MALSDIPAGAINVNLGQFGNDLAGNPVSSAYFGNYKSSVGQGSDEALAREDALTSFLRTKDLQSSAMAFNSSEAQKNRDWETLMSNSAVSRRVADLKNAGLNPLLAVSSASSGASTPSSGSASVGSSSSGSIGKTNTKGSFARLIGSALALAIKMM